MLNPTLFEQVNTELVRLKLLEDDVRIRSIHFDGEEYKADRKALLRNLTGSSAFRSGGPKAGDEHATEA